MARIVSNSLKKRSQLLVYIICLFAIYPGFLPRYHHTYPHLWARILLGGSGLPTCSRFQFHAGTYEGRRTSSGSHPLYGSCRRTSPRRAGVRGKYPDVSIRIAPTLGLASGVSRAPGTARACRPQSAPPCRHLFLLDGENGTEFQDPDI